MSKPRKKSDGRFDLVDVKTATVCDKNKPDRVISDLTVPYSAYVAKSMNDLGIDSSSWRFVADNDSYVVTRCGRMFSVRTVQRSRTGNTILKHRIRELKFSVDRFGYRTARIVVNGRKIHGKVHRLVAKAFIENCASKPCVNHKNGIKTDNHVHNLEWVTPAENLHHAMQNGLWTRNMVSRGVKKKVFRSDYVTLYILNRDLGVPRMELARWNGCSRQTIDNAIGRASRAIAAAQKSLAALGDDYEPSHHL